MKPLPLSENLVFQQRPAHQIKFLSSPQNEVYWFRYLISLRRHLSWPAAALLQPVCHFLLVDSNIISKI